MSQSFTPISEAVIQENTCILRLTLAQIPCTLQYPPASQITKIPVLLPSDACGSSHAKEGTWGLLRRHPSTVRSHLAIHDSPIFSFWKSDLTVFGMVRSSHSSFHSLFFHFIIQTLPTTVLYALLPYAYLSRSFHLFLIIVHHQQVLYRTAHI